MNVVGSKWVHHFKYKEDGSLNCFNACLVSCGFTHFSGANNDETYYFVIWPTTICLVISSALSYKWPLKRLDLKNAFLLGNLKETVYIKQPLGFIYLAYHSQVCLL